MIGTNHDANRSDPIRRKIEMLGTSLSLPTVRRAMGILEGEHASARRGGNDDLLDIRAYEVGDEARQIDWKISARNGRAMIAQRERLSSTRVYLLLDAGVEMTEVCPSDEMAYRIAANALCMFAALSLRRSDEVSLVFGDSSNITRVPFHGGLAQFEHTLDKALDRAGDSRAISTHCSTMPRIFATVRRSLCSPPTIMPSTTRICAQSGGSHRRIRWC